MTSTNWLWDKNMSEEQAIIILKDEKHPDFFRIAATLLSRNNSAREVFAKYLDSLEFYKNWLAIKREMRKDNWNLPRIEYWQAIHEKVKEKYPNIPLRKEKSEMSKLSKIIGTKLKEEREKNKLTQVQFAKKMEISQQMLSRIEKGQENISINSLQKVASRLGLKVNIALTK
jgi:DNA-binding XRE family transcriptional regulator